MKKILEKPINSIYIHLPFCHKKCHYCTFPIQAVGQSNSDNFQHFNDQIQNDYIKYLIQEIKSTLDYYQKTYFNKDFQNFYLSTLYFGGGTPSLITTKNLEKILNQIKIYYPNLEDNYEISIEVDPNTFTKQTLIDYSNLGINRLSIGIQSFNNEDLKYMNRSHDLNAVYESIDLIQNNNNFQTLQNVSFDLIMNTPQQTQEKWENNLNQLIKYNPGHASIYSLAIEENSYFYKHLNLREGQNPLPSDHESHDIYKFTNQFMTQNGYNHYEVSSYNKQIKIKNTQSKHNKLYWEGDCPFFAFGMGASSLINNFRYKRPTNLKKYYNFVKNLEQYPNQLFENLGEKEQGVQQLECILMGGLRSQQGVSKNKVKSKFGNNILEQIESQVKYLQECSNNQLFIEKNPNYFQLDMIQGAYLADEIAFNIIDSIKI